MKTIAAAFFALCLCAGALAQKDNSVLKTDKKQDSSISNKKWPVKRDGANLELEITDQSASIKQGGVTVLEIPVVSISEIGYDTSSHNPGWELLKDAGGLAGSGGEGAIFAPVLLAPAAILLPFKSTKHFVRIRWEDKEDHSEAYLAVRKQDCHAVLNELQRLSGKPWVDLPKARKKLVSEIKQAKGQSAPLEIDRKIVLNGTEMKPGRYQAVFLERPGNHGEVYFFRGTDANPERIFAHAVVNVEPSNSESTNSGVTYVVEHGVETINAIQFPGKKLVFVSGAPPVRVAK